MGRETFSRAAYTASYGVHASKEGPATAGSERQAKVSGKLNSLVDPAEYGVIRRSLLRLEQQASGLWAVTVGTPMPVETRVDTTGSMGHNVDVVLRVLPDAFELYSQVLPGYDVHVATGIFGDVNDMFVLCRPQFEMVADKIVQQLTLMVPERAGGDFPEDPHYGLFGAAYLTAAYINRIGLKGYDFTVSDASARDMISIRQLKRIFGEEVLEKVVENGYQIDENNLPSTKEIVQDLLKRAHAFFLQVGTEPETTEFWSKVYGSDRVIRIPSTEILPHVQAAIIGLTEGTLSLGDVADFLTKNNVSESDSRIIVRSLANIPIGAQAELPNYGKRPKIGDLFREKTDLWPVDSNDVGVITEPEKDPDTPNWL